MSERINISIKDVGLDIKDRFVQRGNSDREAETARTLGLKIYQTARSIVDEFGGKFDLRKGLEFAARIEGNPTEVALRLYSRTIFLKRGEVPIVAFPIGYEEDKYRRGKTNTVWRHVILSRSSFNGDIESPQSPPNFGYVDTTRSGNLTDIRIKRFYVPGESYVDGSFLFDSDDGDYDRHGLLPLRDFTNLHLNLLAIRTGIQERIREEKELREKYRYLHGLEEKKPKSRLDELAARLEKWLT